MYESADGIHLGETGALFLSYAGRKQSICNKSYDRAALPCHRFLRRPVGKRCGQICADEADKGGGISDQCAYDRGISRKY